LQRWEATLRTKQRIEGAQRGTPDAEKDRSRPAALCDIG
jgi:hypothetical protein